MHYGVYVVSFFSIMTFFVFRVALSDVPEDVKVVHSPGVDSNIEKYIGYKKGIQGHQNSCYLDATVFGLFALSEEFDEVFLGSKNSSNAVGQILWQNIVYPLRT